MSYTKIIQPRLVIPFFAGELVMVRVAAEELKFPTPWIEIGVGFNVPGRVGYDVSRFQLVGEVVRNCTARQVLPGYSLAVEEHILRVKVPAQITLGHDSQRHGPVERPCTAVRFLDTVSVGIVGIGVTCRPGNAVFLVIGIIGSTGRIMGHVASGVISVTGQLVVGQRAHAQVLSAALGDRLLKQVAPGIVAVSIAPIFRQIVYRLLGAIGSSVLRRDQTIKGIVREGLVAAAVAVIGNPENIAIIAVAQVEVIANAE